LDGRRLIVKPKLSKDEAGKLSENKTLEQKKAKLLEDKRNLRMAKEGLLNEEAWIHKEPRLTKAQFELRQRLFISKDKALKASTNLFISKTRLQIRNLPRREFFEKELKELMRVVSQEWAATLSPERKKAEFMHKKLIAHVKIMKDGEKTDVDSGEALASGQAFVEFTHEDLALFAVRYLNNFEVVPTKGLIVDFSMED
jgi:RNA recognition motif-containing protein